MVYDWQFKDVYSLHLVPTEKHTEAYVIMMAADVLVSNRWQTIDRWDSGLDVSNGYEIWQACEISERYDRCSIQSRLPRDL